MSIAFVFGTRPEILKVAPVIKEAEARGVKTILIHTNQHYSYELDQIFFEELDLRTPDFNLGVGSLDHNLQLADMLIKLDQVFKKEKIQTVIVQGDTNSTLAGALAASKLQIQIAHVEAGLRSYDKEMPEEINRIITDSVADYLFPVTKVQESILLSEGKSINSIFVTGNTIVDTLFDRLNYAKNNISVLERVKVTKNNYILLTMHRPSNVDQRDSLVSLLKTLQEVSSQKELIIIWPIHPRTKSKIEQEKISIPSGIKLLDPLGYIDFMSLMINSKYIFTDSGGIQEEACILQKPCLTLRSNTERPETIDVGANKLVGNSLHKINEALSYFDSVDFDWENPFGDGNSSKLIMDVLTK